MKISTIVEYLNHLDTLSVQDAAREAVTQVDSITYSIQNNNIQVPGVLEDLISFQTSMKALLDQYEEKLKQLRDDIRLMLKQYEPEYFTNSQTLYQGMRWNTSSQILGRHLPINAKTKAFLKDRLILYTNWQHPGMVIRPAQSHWLEDLVDLDPLYLVDMHDELLEPLRSKFNPIYQRRLRYYVIDEYNSDKIFWNFPQEQFGFVYSFYYFNFKPLEVIYRYLDEVFALLREGGTFLFGFNDCDYWRAIKQAEDAMYCCYTPGRLVKEYALKSGYEITYDYNDQGGTGWLELRKPGTLDSIRGSQALASILRMPEPIIEQSVIEPATEPEVVDKSVKQLYNELDLDMLIDLASILNVDISQDKTKREFNVKKVRRSISAYLESVNYPEEQLRQLFKPKENK